MPLGETFVMDGMTHYRCISCANVFSSRARAVRCCTFTCGGCGTRYNHSESAENCCPRYNCPNCNQRYFDIDSAETCCTEVSSEYEDTEPDFLTYEEEVSEAGGLFAQRDPARSSSRSYPPEILGVDPEHLLYVEPIEGRSARPCSIEQELTAGGRRVASLIYDLGFSDYNEICNYSRESLPGRMLVKEDGSLPHSGGEVVYSRYVLGEGAHTHQVSKALACIHALRDIDLVGVGPAAGTHIHLGAFDANNANIIGPPQMASLYEIFSFAEDVLFRLAASGWPEHRGHGYSTPLVKMDRVSPGKIAQETQHSRYFSLSFTRLLNAARTCTCGACIAGGWHECVCGVLHNGTVEWRIFNACTDPKVIHAWTLLAHGLTAASLTHELGSLEPNEFYWNGDPADQHAWVLGWILWNCPFTDPERQLIIECARNSPRLNINWDEFDRDGGGWGQLRIPSEIVTPPEVPPPPFDPDREQQTGPFTYTISGEVQGSLYERMSDQMRAWDRVQETQGWNFTLESEYPEGGE